MIIRAIWWTFLGVIAIVTASVQLDRQSAVVTQIAPNVPSPARGFAQSQIVAQALLAQDNDRAVSEARRLVERRPIPAESLRLLAQAQFAAGQTDQSALTIQYAAQRGWRDPLAQESMLRLALAADDAPEAARRFAALFLFQGTDDALLEELAPMVLGQPGGAGRQTLTDIVAGAERWHPHFVRRGARVLPAEGFVEIVIEAAAQGAIFECDLLIGVRPMIEARSAGAHEPFDAFIARQC